MQLAKLAGNHVIATCSSDDKAEFLKKLGCDRVVPANLLSLRETEATQINYKKEDLFETLKKEYPTGHASIILLQFFCPPHTFLQN